MYQEDEGNARRGCLTMSNFLSQELFLSHSYLPFPLIPHLFSGMSSSLVLLLLISSTSFLSWFPSHFTAFLSHCHLLFSVCLLPFTNFSLCQHLFYQKMKEATWFASLWNITLKDPLGRLAASDCSNRSERPWRPRLRERERERGRARRPRLLPLECSHYVLRGEN